MGQFQPSAINDWSRTTTAPTGTSPRVSALCARRMACSIHCSSSPGTNHPAPGLDRWFRKKVNLHSRPDNGISRPRQQFGENKTISNSDRNPTWIFHGTTIRQCFTKDCLNKASTTGPSRSGYWALTTGWCFISATASAAAKACSCSRTCGLDIAPGNGFSPEIHLTYEGTFSSSSA